MPKGYEKEDHFDEFEAIGRNPFYKKATRRQPAARDGSDRRSRHRVREEPTERQTLRTEHVVQCLPRRGRRSSPRHRALSLAAAVDGMYEDVEMYPPRLNDPAIFDAPARLSENDDQPRTFFLAVEHGPEIPDQHARLLPHGQRDRRCDWAFHEGARRSRARRQHDHRLLRRQRLSHGQSRLGRQVVALRRIAPRAADRRRSARCPKRSGAKSPMPLALNLDLPATFLDWAGVEVPERYQGRSLKPIVDGEKPADWRTETFHEHFAVRNRIPAFEGLRNERVQIRSLLRSWESRVSSRPEERSRRTGQSGRRSRSTPTRSKAMRERTTKRVAELRRPARSAARDNSLRPPSRIPKPRPPSP